MGLVPKSVQSRMSAEDWIYSFQEQHALHQGLEGVAARKLYVLCAKALLMFGCAIFPCCKEIPPG